MGEVEAQEGYNSNQAWRGLDAMDVRGYIAERERSRRWQLR